MDNSEPKQVLYVANYGNVAHRLLYPGDKARRAKVMCGYATPRDWDTHYFYYYDSSPSRGHCKRCDRMYRLYGPGTKTD